MTLVATQKITCVHGIQTYNLLAHVAGSILFELHCKMQIPQAIGLEVVEIYFNQQIVKTHN